MNPLKLYEYIAAGKVVITTKISGVSNISQYIIEANSKEDFVDKIELVKSKPLPNPNFVSASLPNCYTWKEISLEFISHVLNKKEGAFDEE
jgi:hypothetical protein